MRICEIEKCNNKHFALGFCQKYYVKYKKYGDSLAGYSLEFHGKINTQEYKVWANMKSRCYNKKNKDYPYYGGRGIKVCDRWLHSFPDFYEDMGKKPFNKAQIDRENNDKNYTPNNCRWVTRTNNMRNSSATKLNIDIVNQLRFLYETRNYTIIQLSELVNIGHSQMYRIIKYEQWL